jgi:hypothetical protein
VIDLDPDAARVARQRDLDRHIEVQPDQNGMAEIWGSVRAPDAAAFDTKLNELAATVCSDDPRTTTQRRADALSPLAAGATSMPCSCGTEGCTAGGSQPKATEIVINVLAEATTVEGTSDKPGYLPGYGALPAAMVTELAKQAKLRSVTVPKELVAEPHYRPSAALTRFIRCRDLTCRWPGCDCPAEFADIDHTVPYPLGPTHPSNNKPYCRIHHLFKTFYAGPAGWTEQQLPDGTIVWTSPSGRTYTTTPSGALFFPQLGEPTGTLVLPGGTTASQSGTGDARPETHPSAATLTGCSGNAPSTAPATLPILRPSRARRSASRRSRTGRACRARRARTIPIPHARCRRRPGTPRGRRGR